MNGGDLAFPGFCYLWSECGMCILQMTGSLLACAEFQAVWEYSSHPATLGHCVSVLIICHQTALPCSNCSWETRLNREVGHYNWNWVSLGRVTCISLNPRLECHWLWLGPLKNSCGRKSPNISAHQELCSLLIISSKSSVSILPEIHCSFSSLFSCLLPLPPSALKKQRLETKIAKVLLEWSIMSVGVLTPITVAKSVKVHHLTL